MCRRRKNSCVWSVAVSARSSPAWRQANIPIRSNGKPEALIPGLGSRTRSQIRSVGSYGCLWPHQPAPLRVSIRLLVGCSPAKLVSDESRREFNRISRGLKAGKTEREAVRHTFPDVNSDRNAGLLRCIVDGFGVIEQ